MTTMAELQILVSYVLAEKNREVLTRSGMSALPQDRRDSALRGLQDLGWIGHSGVADFGESYSLTKEGRRIAAERPPVTALDSKLQEQIEALRLVDSDVNGDRREGLQRLIKMECDHGNWDSAVVNSYELKRLAEKTRDIPRQAFALFHLGKVEIAQNRWDEALESHLGALEKYMESGDRRGVSETNRSIGVIYGNKGDRASAKRCFENSLETAKAIGDKELEAKAEGNLAIIFDMEGRFKEAEKAHKNCLKYFVETGDHPGVARTSNNLGVLSISKEEFGAGADYFEKAIESCRAMKNRSVLSIALVNAGHCYAKLGDVGRAIARTDESVTISKEFNDLNQLAHSYMIYGLIEFHNSNLEEAFKWFEKSIRTAIASGVEATLAGCYYEYGIALIEATADLRLAKKLLKKASNLFRDLGNADRAILADMRLAAL
jgi:tetratricopeptide (TPR) repeat protein